MVDWEHNNIVRCPGIMGNTLKVTAHGSLITLALQEVAALGAGKSYGACCVSGSSFIKTCNFTSNYVVYWSQLTATIQCSLQPVS